MKKIIKAGAEKLKALMLLVLAAAIAVLALPMGLIGASSRKAVAEVVTGEHDGGTPNISTSASTVYKLNLYYYLNPGKDKPEDYTGYNLWAWSKDVEGTQYNAVEETINVTIDKDNDTKKDTKWLKFSVAMADIKLDGENVIGFIVRKSTATNDWALKAAGGNCYAPLTAFGEAKKENGNTIYEATIYMADDLAELYDNPQDAYDHKPIPKFKTAEFRSFTTLRVTVSPKITESSVLVLRDSNNNEIKKLVPKASTDALDKTKNFAPGSSLIDFDLGENFKIDFAEVYTVYDEPTGDFDPEVNYPSNDVTMTKLYDTSEFNALYEYEGELGAQYAEDKTTFTVWAPTSASLTLCLYDEGEGGDPTDEIPMEKGKKGEWTVTVDGDLNGTYYTYKVENKKGAVKEVVDPYARSAGRNGRRGMILDLTETNPEGWENHKRPEKRGSYTNAIIYEAHIRDLTMHESSNVSAAHKGKFLGLTETASAANGNKQTPLDYIKALGITELHILPMFDINSVDEYIGEAEYDAKGQYNWGYDPLNYNVPEGSYSTDPTDGTVRVKELKQMIMALHEAGIRVIMDVVYNHVADVDGSNFQALMPGYYFRTNSDGSWKSESGCGNDTASERAMYRKFMVESVNYWAKEYQLDGFRFDLMGLHDHVTMNKIYDTLAANNPDRDIMVYGEGWKMNSLVETTKVKPANMYNSSLMPNIAFFDDATRDTIKGGGFGHPIDEKGFISGSKIDAAIYMGAVGGTNHPDGAYYNAEKSPFASSPTQNINYVSCHDNSTLWDKINASTAGVDNDTRKAMNRLGAAAVFTSQGPVFFLAGEELLRTKHTTKPNEYDNSPQKWADSDYYFADNSYKSPDSVNAINWELATANAEMVEFYKQLIELRKNSPMFHLTSRNQINDCVKIVDAKLRDGIVSYAVRDPNSDEYAVVLFNGTDKAAEVKIPNGEYSVYVNGDKANATTPLSTFTGDTFTVGAYSAVVMKGELDEDKLDAWEEEVKPSTTPPTPSKPNTPADDSDSNDDDGNLGLALGLGIGIPAAVLIAGGVVFGVMYSKKKKGKGSEKVEPKTDEQPEQPEEQPEQPEEQPEQPEEQPEQPEEQPEGAAEENAEPEAATEEPTDKE